MENIVDPSKKTKPKKCVIYWMKDQQVSTESVMDKENATENAVCLIKWRGKGPYSRKIIKISGMLTFFLFHFYV